VPLDSECLFLFVQSCSWGDASAAGAASVCIGRPPWLEVFCNKAATSYIVHVTYSRYSITGACGRQCRCLLATLYTVAVGLSYGTTEAVFVAQLECRMAVCTWLHTPPATAPKWSSGRAWSWRGMDDPRLQQPWPLFPAAYLCRLQTVRAVACLERAHVALSRTGRGSGAQFCTSYVRVVGAESMVLPLMLLLLLLLRGSLMLGVVWPPCTLLRASVACCSLWLCAVRGQHMQFAGIVAPRALPRARY
jgi:hypothetical protein